MVLGLPRAPPAGVNSYNTDLSYSLRLRLSTLYRLSACRIQVIMFLHACTILFLLSLGDASRTFSRRDADVSAVCNALIAEYPRQVTYGPPELNVTLSIDYGDARNDYWSQANSDLKPACVFFPTNTEEVAFAVKALGQHEQAHWAVKGAGHNANTGYAATDGGVLISLRQGMETARLDTDTMLAHVRPGCRWMDVFKVLDPYHRAVVSGRLGVVGVPGLTLGGGLSFMSTEHVSILPGRYNSC